MSTLAKNKKVHYDYQVIEEFEAGLVLTGAEVKSIKLGHLSLMGAFVSLKDGKAILKNMYISPYIKAGADQSKYDPEQERKLLLNKKEILHLTSKMKDKGLTIIPISVYTTRRLIKVKIALVKGKKKYDKRQDIKKKDIQKNIRNKLKSY